MNSFSFSLIVLFGLLFGWVWPDLLEELGVARKKARSGMSALVLPFLSFIGYFAYPLLLVGAFSFNDVGSFSSAENGIFLWLAVALLAGGFVKALSDWLKGLAKKP